MMRPLLVLPLGLLAGALAFSTAYWLQTHHHHLPVASAPAHGRSGHDLEWLRQEFHLSEAEFTRIASLHEEYKPTCSRLCQRIAEQNERLRSAVARTNLMTEELRALVAETGRARDECRTAMLTHLYAVAREMPPTEGARYLQVMLGATCVLQNARTIDAIQPGDAPGAAAASPHAHHE